MSEAMRIWPAAALPATHELSEGVEFGGDAFGDPAVRLVRNVSVPTLTPYLPDPSIATGTAVIVAPGGGFQFLSWTYEGTEVAEWLQERGIAAFLLRYRLGDTGPTDDDFRRAVAYWTARMLDADGNPKPAKAGSIAPDVEPLAYADGKRAVGLVRDRADEWGLRPDRIGMIGFSAGAFVATATAVGDALNERASFIAPVYGGAVLGELDEETPPMFCVVAADDPLCLDTCLDTFRAWRSAGLPAELHVYEQGGHGFGTRKLGLPVDGWLDRFGDWLQSRGLLA